MAKDTTTTKNRIIAQRKESLRDQLAAGGHVQHVVEIAQKLSNEAIELDPNMVQRLKSAADIKLKLINKYLPDVKSIEHTGENGGPINMGFTVVGG